MMSSTPNATMEKFEEEMRRRKLYIEEAMSYIELHKHAAQYVGLYRFDSNVDEGCLKASLNKLNEQLAAYMAKIHGIMMKSDDELREFQVLALKEKAPVGECWKA